MKKQEPTVNNQEQTRKRNGNLAAKVKDITDEQWIQIESDTNNLSEGDFYSKWGCSPSGINKYLLQWKTRKEVEGQFKDEISKRDQEIEKLRKELGIIENENEQLKQTISTGAFSDPSVLGFKMKGVNKVRASIYVDKDVLDEWREKSKDFESQSALMTTCMKHFMDHHWPEGDMLYTREKGKTE